MIRLEGKKVSQTRREILTQRTTEFQHKYGCSPGLAVVLVGDDPGSQIYVKNKELGCKKVGIESFRHDLKRNCSESQLLDLVHALNEDQKVHGILVQFPLPPQLSKDKVLETIHPMKDADGLGYESLGLLFAGKPRIQPCTPHGIMKILEYYDIEISGKRATVIGRSQIVGKPMAQLLLASDATVTICHSKTQDLAEHTRSADIVVVAAGRPREFGRDFFGENSTVIDVGMHRIPGKDKPQICGDVRFEELQGWVHAATPVPGGVGPMTITMLLENTIHLAELQMERQKEMRANG